MFNAFQWNCFNLVYTCNIALILFLKCNVTKFRIPSPLVTQCHTSSTPSPLNVWRNLWMSPCCAERTSFFLFLCIFYWLPFGFHPSLICDKMFFRRENFLHSKHVPSPKHKSHSQRSFINQVHSLYMHSSWRISCNAISN